MDIKISDSVLCRSFVSSSSNGFYSFCTCLVYVISSDDQERRPSAYFIPTSRAFVVYQG